MFRVVIQFENTDIEEHNDTWLTAERRGGDTAKRTPDRLCSFTSEAVKETSLALNEFTRGLLLSFFFNQQSTNYVVWREWRDLFNNPTGF